MSNASSPASQKSQLHRAVQTSASLSSNDEMRHQRMRGRGPDGCENLGRYFPVRDRARRRIADAVNIEMAALSKTQRIISRGRMRQVISHEFERPLGLLSVFDCNKAAGAGVESGHVPKGFGASLGLLFSTN